MGNPFSDDFSTEITMAEYTLVDTQTTGGFGQFLYDSGGERLQVLTGDNVGLQFSHSLSPLESGQFQVDFNPVVKYPRSRWIVDRTHYNVLLERGDPFCSIVLPAKSAESGYNSAIKLAEKIMKVNRKI